MGTRREQQGMSHVPQLGLCTNVLQPVNRWFQGQGGGTWGVCLTFTPRNVTQVVGFILSSGRRKSVQQHLKYQITPMQYTHICYKIKKCGRAKDKVTGA